MAIALPLVETGDRLWGQKLYFDIEVHCTSSKSDIGGDERHLLFIRDG
jgi:hypothetical protein